MHDIHLNIVVKFYFKKYKKLYEYVILQKRDITKTQVVGWDEHLTVRVVCTGMCNRKLVWSMKRKKICTSNTKEKGTETWTRKRQDLRGV